MLYYNRKAVLLIGAKDAETAIEVSGLRVLFNITKTRTQSDNSAIITVYNLSSSSRSRIEGTDSVRAILKAGYEEHGDSPPILFSGSIRLVSSVKQGPDIVTTLTASDGYDVLSGHAMSVSFGSNTSIRSIVDTVVKELGVTLVAGDGLDVVLSKSLSGGFSFSGTSREILNKIQKMSGLGWSVQNGDLYLTKKNQTITGKIVQLSASSGLIGTPEKIVLKDDTTDETASGWKVKSFLEPRIEPHGQLAIDSVNKQAVGQFAIVKVNHEGDTHGQQWHTTAEVAI
jgi:hypothetical protein